MFCVRSGQLLQSLSIRNCGFVFEHVPPPVMPSAASLSGAHIMANLSVPTFNRFVLETPDAEADSQDLSHVRIWRAFGPQLVDGEALKMSVCIHVLLLHPIESCYPVILLESHFFSHRYHIIKPRAAMPKCWWSLMVIVTVH